MTTGYLKAMRLFGESHSKNQRDTLQRDTQSTSVSGVRLSEWARRLAPHLDVLSASAPEPELQDGDVIAVFVAVDDARLLMHSWERIESADRSVGFVALGKTPEGSTTDASAAADPEGVTRDAAIRALTGGAVGAGIGVGIAAIIGFVAGWGTGAVAGALGAAVFGAVVGALIAYVLRSGWGDGYLQSYVDPEATELAVCALACREPDGRATGIANAHDASARAVLLVGAGGRTRNA